MATNRQAIIEEYEKVVWETIEKLEALDKKYFTFAKMRFNETRVTKIGSGIPEFIRTPHVDELLFYPQPAENRPVPPRQIDPELMGGKTADKKPEYRLPDIDCKRFMTEDDYYDELYKLEFPDRSFFYAACGKYFKMTYKEVNSMIAGLNPDKAEERINAWRQVVRKQFKKEA